MKLRLRKGGEGVTECIAMRVRIDHFGFFDLYHIESLDHVSVNEFLTQEAMP